VTNNAVVTTSLQRGRPDWGHGGQLLHSALRDVTAEVAGGDEWSGPSCPTRRLCRQLYVALKAMDAALEDQFTSSIESFIEDI